jgi:ABC-type transport system substrate-binding protein
VSASAVDERTLEIQLREPRNDFLYLLALPPFFAWPRRVYEREGRDWHRAVPLVGNGPFVLTSRDEDSVVIAAAPSWYGARGNVGEVTLELEASPAVAADRWRRGEYDVLHSVLTSRAVADDETVVQHSPGMFTWYLGFNARRAPLDDARVRRALAHAVDRHGPAELLRGTATATGGLVPPTIPGHSHRVAPACDPDRARALLSEAGYADGRGLGEIVLACLDLWEDAASDVAAQLAGIGVRVRLVPAASDPDLKAAIEEHAHAYLWAWGGDVPQYGPRLPRSDPPLGPVALSRRRARGVGSSGLAPRPGRTPAHVPRVRANLDRRASGRSADRVR